MIYKLWCFQTSLPLWCWYLCNCISASLPLWMTKHWQQAASCLLNNHPASFLTAADHRELDATQRGAQCSSAAQGCNCETASGMAKQQANMKAPLWFPSSPWTLLVHFWRKFLKLCIYIICMYQLTVDASNVLPLQYDYNALWAYYFLWRQTSRFVWSWYILSMNMSLNVQINSQILVWASIVDISLNELTLKFTVVTF